MRRPPIRLALVALPLAGLLLAGARADAATMFRLENHPGGNAQVDGPYGLRIDDASGLNTFDFESGGASVVFEITGADTASIGGMVKHNQSGQLWSLSASLGTVVTTNEADGGPEPWYDPMQPNALYDGVVEDMILFGDTTFGDGTNNLKQLAFEADRIGFFVNDVTLEFLGADPSLAVFDPDGNGDGLVELEAYPDDPTMLPMIVSKGHRLDALTDQLAGFGWLEEEGAAHIYTRDFLFTFAEPIPEPSAAALFATGFLLVGSALRRRR